MNLKKLLILIILAAFVFAIYEWLQIKPEDNSNYEIRKPAEKILDPLPTCEGEDCGKG